MSNVVYFVSKSLTERIAKISAALRHVGLKTVVFYEREKNNVEYAEFFDDPIAVYSTSTLARFIKESRIEFLHVYSASADDFALAAFQSGRKVAFDFKDFLLPTHFHRSEPPVDVVIQSRMVGAAAAVIFRDWQLPLAVKRGLLKFPKRKLFFPDFCWGGQQYSNMARSRDASPTSLAIVGNHAIERLRPDRVAFGILRTISMLLEQGFSVKYFPFPHGTYDYADYVSLEKASGGNFSIRPFMSPLGLREELATCAWGLYVNQFMIFPEFRHSLQFDPAHLDYSLGSRVFDYLGAGLPILATPHKLIDRFVSHFGVGLALDGRGFFDLDRSLESFDFDTARRNVQLYSESFLNIDRRVSRLLNLYNSM